MPSGVTDIAAILCDGNVLLRDVKAGMPDGVVKTWTFAISGGESGEDMVISWQQNHIPDQNDGSMGMNQIYGGYSFDLYDPVTGEHIDMRTINSYSFSYDGSRELTITVSANVLDADGKGEIPTRIALEQNIPNPFNASTELTFSLPVEADVIVEVMNISGRVVNTLLNSEMQSGVHSVRWDGTDDSGKELSSGVYFYRLRTDGYSETRKMMLLK